MCVFVTVTSLRIVTDCNEETTYLLNYHRIFIYIRDQSKQCSSL